MKFMSQRVLKADPKKARELKKLMARTRNNTERKRLQIVVLYLWWMSMREVVSAMLVASSTVESAVHGYAKKWDSFYKTNWKWRIESKENKKLVKQAKQYIDSKDHVDINDVRRYLERKNKTVYGYQKVHWLVRKKLLYNYQKPFVTSKKQHPYAKEIAEWRLRKAIYEVALEEWEIDGESVKNKKIAIWGAEH